MTDAVVLPSLSARGGAALHWRSFFGLLRRDLRVLRREFVTFLVRTVMNPLLFVFVFTYVFPRIGQSFTARNGASFATILLPGLVAVSIMFQGVTAVALPLAVELGATGEIFDRVMSPLPVAAVAMEKMVFSAIQSLVAAAAVFPLVMFLPATRVPVQVSSWSLLIAVVLLASLAAGAMGLALGTLAKPQQVGLVFSVVLIPVTFLGCVYYPWAMLQNVRWLQVAVLVNPLVYMSEGLRAALTPTLPHMPVAAILVALALALVTLTWVGMNGFLRRVVT